MTSTLKELVYTGTRPARCQHLNQEVFFPVEMARTYPGWRWKSLLRTETPTSATWNTVDCPSLSRCSGMRQREQKPKAMWQLGLSKSLSVRDVRES